MNFLEKLKFRFNPLTVYEVRNLLNDYASGCKQWCEQNNIIVDYENFEFGQKLLQNAEEIKEADFKIVMHKRAPELDSQIEYTQTCQTLAKRDLQAWEKKGHNKIMRIWTVLHEHRSRAYMYYEYNRGLNCTCISQQDIDDVMSFLISIREQYSSCLVLIDESEDDGKKLERLKAALEENSILYKTQYDSNALNPYHHLVIIRLNSDSEKLESAVEKIMSKASPQKPEVICLTFNRCLDDEDVKLKSTILTVPTRPQEEEKNSDAIEVSASAEANGSALIEELERYFESKRILSKCTENWETPRKSDVKCFSMYNYYPTTCKWELDKKMKQTRKLIWDFKASNEWCSIEKLKKKHSYAANIFCKDMAKCMQHFFGEETRRFTLVCVPASARQANILRFNDFSEMICKELDMENGVPHIKVILEGCMKDPDNPKAAVLSIDQEFFKNKNVLLFDDIIASGKSMEMMRRRLESLGATVICGFSIGRLRYEKESCDPIDKIK